MGVRSEVIPANWAAHHVPTVGRTRTAGAELYAGADPGWVGSPSGELVRDLGPLVWSGLVRFQQLGRSGEVPAGEQDDSYHEYLVVLPEDFDLATTFVWVKIVSPTDDALALNRLFKVTDVQLGSLRWERDVHVTDVLG